MSGVQGPNPVLFNETTGYLWTNTEATVILEHIHSRAPIAVSVTGDPAADRATAAAQNYNPYFFAHVDGATYFLFSDPNDANDFVSRTGAMPVADYPFNTD